MRRAIALGALLALAIPMPAAAAPEPAPAPAAGPAAGDTATGHDHLLHARQVAAAGAPAIACERCHALARDGRLAGPPGHAACFGACHGPAPRGRPGAAVALTPARRRVCTACHAPAALDRAAASRRERLRMDDALRGAAPEHALALSHARHLAPSQARGGCLTCHDVPQDDRATGARAPRTAGHDRCIPCHGAPGQPAPRAGAPGPAAPPMSACERCHVPVAGAETNPDVGPDVDPDVGPDVGPSTAPGSAPSTAPDTRGPHLVSGPYPVQFTHQAHQARASMDCAGCHAAVPQTHGSALPPPRMDQCGTCHDGARAFSVTGTACRRCHTTRAPRSGLGSGLGAGPAPRPRRGAPFSHRAHDARGMALPCTACHALDAGGAPRPPAPDHAPCADAGCHRDQFFARAPTICGACHLGTAPWARLHFDPPPRPETELGARFSHALHLTGTAPAPSCTACHGTRTRAREMGLPADHDACTGAGCHAGVAAAEVPDRGFAAELPDGGAAPATPPPGATPALAKCEACHVQGLLARRRAMRLRSPWSVRARFRHAPHRADPASGAPVACASCHADVARAADMDAIAGPPKAACAPCHDGAAAFKLTGHGCARCHGGPM